MSNSRESQFSTVAIINNDAEVQERVTYSAYGRARHHWPHDVDGDGDADATDVSIISTIAAGSENLIGEDDYRAECDLNRDGAVTSADTAIANGLGTMSALRYGELSAPGTPSGSPPGTGVDNPIGFDGYVFNAEAELYTVRFRWYSPELGRWLERDPAANRDDVNIYSLVKSRPVIYTDVMGFSGRPPTGGSGFYRPPTVRERLAKCLEGCEQWLQMPWYLRNGVDVAECRDTCHMNHLSTGFWHCNRNMDKEGAGCTDQCAMGIADFFENHGFIAYDLDLRFAYSLEGTEKAGELPTHERKCPGSSATCYRCYRKDSVLQYGAGEGKGAFDDATIDDIKDCIRSARAREDYGAFTYNCNDWVEETLDACGLVCDKDMSKYWFMKDGPYGIPYRPPGRIN